MDNHTVTYNEYHKAIEMIKKRSFPDYVLRLRVNEFVLARLHKIGQNDIISAEVRLALMNDILERVTGD